MEAIADGSIWALLTAYVVRTPLFLVLVVVALAAITRRRMLPRQTALVLAAVSLLLIDELVGIYLAQVLPVWVIGQWRPAHPTHVLSVVLPALSFLRSVAQAAAFSLMAWAALGRIVRPFEKA